MKKKIDFNEKLAVAVGIKEIKGDNNKKDDNESDDSKSIIKPPLIIDFYQFHYIKGGIFYTSIILNIQNKRY